MEALLQPGCHRPTSTDLAKPDFPSIEEKLKCKGMTRQLLWEEYAEAHPGNHYCYSRFTALFRRWRQTQQLSMRQTHPTGRVRSCLWITAGRRWRWSTPIPARRVVPRYSSLSLAGAVQYRFPAAYCPFLCMGDLSRRVDGRRHTCRALLIDGRFIYLSLFGIRAPSCQR